MVQPQAKILVVDDEAKNVKLLEALVLPRGYQVVCASNGAEALQQVQQERPELILLDVMMPGMAGTVTNIAARMRHWVRPAQGSSAPRQRDGLPDSSLCVNSEYTN